MKTLGSQALARFRAEAHHRFPSVTVRPPRKVPLAAVARALGVSKSMVAHVENGVRTPSLDLALKLDRLGVCEPGDWHKPAQGHPTHAGAAANTTRHCSANVRAHAAESQA